MNKNFSFLLFLLIPIYFLGCSNSTEPTESTGKPIIKSIDYFPISENKTLNGTLQGKIEVLDEDGNIVYVVYKPETVYKFKFGQKEYFNLKNCFPFIDISGNQNSIRGYFSQSDGETMVVTDNPNDNWVIFLPEEITKNNAWSANPSAPEKQQVNCVYKEYFGSYSNGIKSYSYVVKIKVSYYDSTKVTDLTNMSKEVVVKLDVDFLFAYSIGLIQVKLNYFSEKTDLIYISFNDRYFEHSIISGEINF